MKEDNHYNELVLGLSQRNETAIKLLFTMYFRSLCFFAEKIIGNSAEAEDLATDAFLKLIKAEKAFNCLEEIRSYLFTSVKNACIDRLRKQKREAVQLAGPFTTIADAPYPELLEREMLTAQLLQLVYAEIERLPEKCRRIFKGYYVEQKSTGDLANELGLSPQTVLNQKARALYLLKIAIGRNGISMTGCTFLFFLPIL